MTQGTKTTPPAVDEFPAFAAAWDAFFSSVRRARGRAAEVPGELSLSQYQLVIALAEGERLRLGELAQAAGVAAPTATRMIDGLERDGIVSRRQAADDRRAVDVALTAKGRKLLSRKQAVVDAKRHAIFDALDPDERRQAEHLLRRFAEAIDEL